MKRFSARFPRLRRKIDEESNLPSPLNNPIFKWFRTVYFIFMALLVVDLVIPATETVCGATTRIETGGGFSRHGGYSTSSGPVLYACDHRLKISRPAFHALSGEHVTIGITPIFRVYRYFVSPDGRLFYPANYGIAAFLLALVAALLVASWKWNSDVLAMFTAAFSPITLCVVLWLLYF